MIRLKEIRKSKCLSARELGEKVGVTGNYIYTLENEKRTASLRVLREMARVLNTSIDELVEEVK